MDKYQRMLKHRTESTNVVKGSYSVEYSGFIVYEAKFNGYHICWTTLDGVKIYSKSTRVLCKKINQFIKSKRG